MQPANINTNAFVSTYGEYFSPNEAVIETTQTGRVSKNSIELLKSWIYHNQQTINNYLNSVGAIPRIFTSQDIINILKKIDQWLYYKIGDWKVYFRSFEELEENMNLVDSLITTLSYCWIEHALTWHNPNNSKIFSKVSIKSFIDSFRLRCSQSQLDFLSRYTKISEIFDKLSTLKIGTCVDIYNSLPYFVKKRIIFLLNFHPSSYYDHCRGDKFSNDKAALLNYIKKEIQFKEVNSIRPLLDPKPLPPYEGL
jgi:hypothetical protein